MDQRSASSSLHEMPRLAEIVRVALRYGAGPMLRELGFASSVDAPAPAAKDAAAVRLRQALEELGPTFVKLGQMLSMRSDLFPEHVTTELERLQSEVAPFPADEAEAIIARELGAAPMVLFREFSREPMAAASMAQVHRARLHDGTEVVVKVQRPGIAAKVAADVALMRHAARLVHRHLARLRRFNFPDLIEEFADTISGELDFTREGANAEAFADANRGVTSLYVPSVYWERTSPAVLTMAFSHGRTIAVLDSTPDHGSRLAAELMRLFLMHVFEHGIFHADPHPGNLFVLPDGRLCFHDFGQLGRIAPRERQRLRQLFLAVMARDAGWVADTYLAMGGVEPELDRARFVRDLEGALERFYGTAPGAAAFSAILAEFVSLAREHSIHLVREFSLMAKAFMLIEADCRALDREFDSIAAFRGFVPHLLFTMPTPGAAFTSLAQLQRRLEATGELLAGIPLSANRLAHSFQERHEEGSSLRDATVQALRAELARAAMIVGLAILVLAITLGSTVVLGARADSDFERYALGGLVVALLLAASWLVLAWRSRRHH